MAYNEATFLNGTKQDMCRRVSGFRRQHHSAHKPVESATVIDIDRILLYLGRYIGPHMKTDAFEE